MIPGGTSHLPDTFLSTPGFSKGVAFINGFNLGWYWPVKGPQQTLYIPGSLLQSHNELVLLEMEGAPSHLSGSVLTMFIPLLCEEFDSVYGSESAL